MGSYTPLDQELVNNRDWPLVTMLAVSPEERIGVLEKIFLIAVNKKDDTASEKLLGLIFRAIDDYWLLKHYNARFGELKFSQELREDETRAAKAKAAKMLHLWQSLPLETVEPCLLKTKSAMLTMVANYMAETQDGDESDELLESLLKVRKSLYNDKTRKIFENVLRAATDKRYRPERLLRHFLIIATNHRDYLTYDSVMMKIFALGFVKHETMPRLEIALRAVASVYSKAPPALR